MKNYRKHIDDFFREKLGRYTETPPPDVWDELDGRLDTLAPSAPVAPYRWLWHVAIISLILTLSVSVVRKIAGNSNLKPIITQLAENTTTSEPASKPTAAPAHESVIAQSFAGAEKAGVQTTIAPAAVVGNAGNQSTEPGKEAEHGSQSNDGNESVKGNTFTENTTTNTKTKRKAHKPDDTYRLARQQKASGVKQTATSEGTLPETSYAATPATEERRTVDNTGNNNDASTGKPIGSTVATDNKTTLTAPVIAKKDSTNSKKVADKNKPNNRPLKFESGIKIGFEDGMGDAATKAVIAPYLQYNVSPRMSVMVQPAIKYANISTRNVASQSYYSVNEDGKTTQGQTTITTPTVGGEIDTYYHTSYHYSQTHDSIVKSYTYGGTYAEFELPVLLKYAICPRLSVYGGVNLLYSKLTGVTENGYTGHGILKSFDTTVVSMAAPAPPQGAGVTYSGRPFSDYKKPASTQGSLFGVGYVLGFTYTMHDRWLLDVLAEQSPVKPNTVVGYNTNAPIAAPYFRLSVGYRFVRPRAASTDNGSE